MNGYIKAELELLFKLTVKKERQLLFVYRHE